MPARKVAKNVPGTERYRDERRKDSRPKMHGGQWHDHDAKEFEPASLAGEQPTAGESGGDRAGTGHVRKSATSQGRVRRKRTTPVGKGPKPKTRAAQGGRSGMKSRGRAGNPG